MSTWSVNKPDLKSADCEELAAYLRDAYHLQDALVNRLWLLFLDLKHSRFGAEILELQSYATYVQGTFGESITYVESRGEKGLAEQVGHPAAKGALRGPDDLGRKPMPPPVENVEDLAAAALKMRHGRRR